MQTIALNNLLEVNLQRNKVSEDRSVFGDKVGILGTLFGCWHENLSRPFSENQTAYRSCLSCGARKKFDTKTLKTHGAYYHPPIIRGVEF